MTAQQLAETLGDVPPATLYRHLNRLTGGGLLRVVTERRVRGTLEKVYTLNILDAQVRPAELERMSREDHLRTFVTFVASLLDDYSRYLKNREPVNLLADGVSYGKFTAALSDEELAAMSKKLSAIIVSVLKNKPAPGRKRRIIASLIMPDMETAPRLANPGAMPVATAARNRAAKKGK